MSNELQSVTDATFVTFATFVGFTLNKLTAAVCLR